ncbi:hypothetical protein [Streptomyces sp. NBC_00872]|uniref:hypothetical protein n=1 Tax=Streptomyces sp. NBC_00872 TaxID=2903686 RepID=UPI00386AA4BC|nr:hypothetical protein OG214_04240 [Streptomyces sp. NBC_00872]
MVISRAYKALLVGVATVLAATATAFGVAEAANGSTATAAAEDDMPHAVEDFSYPNAEKIEAETGATLKRGDGHLLMTSCDGNEDILIMSRDGQLDFCFNVIAKPAYLALEIPQAYGIWTSDDPVKTTIRAADGTTTVINAPANNFTGYGESGQVVNPSSLIELRVTG